jgi:hypothetical protein
MEQEILDLIATCFDQEAQALDLADDPEGRTYTFREASKSMERIAINIRLRMLQS